ncbi:LANO_0G00694g1_1 [Lachancea nothofagi CBS 11611]|uniref:LANO_0G00694g1_1 n=1 Tax=Lachancea nothofagi CBS 11611 TaxID=1266666 RepID=A0A1G4KED7_9SACH|nr:LANO_0G00694g1_1 [Lachancea nothofagi CBS 11611]
MDLLGDIVEKNVAAPCGVSSAPTSGFPELYEPEKVSSWKTRLHKKRQSSKFKAATTNADTLKPKLDIKEPETEADRINHENLARMQQMSAQQLEQEKRDILESLDPKVVQGLMKRLSKREPRDGSGNLEDSFRSAPLFAEVEGAPGTWIGGSHEFPDLPRLDDDAVNKALGIKEITAKHVKFEGVDHESSDDNPSDYSKPLPDDDDIAPQEYQFVQQMDHMKNEDLLNDVHFMKPVKDQKPEFEPLDINDPAFDSKLHEKYFPDLPKETDKLAWMKPATKSVSNEIVQDVAQCRFDFKGNLVPPNREFKTTKDGLHHHAEDPELAGYTIGELQHLSRSTFPPQRCIAIQTLGRILYKLGKQSYAQLIPEVDAETYEEMGGTSAILNHIYGMFWDLCKSHLVIESLTEAADGAKTQNLSVQNYAIDALWLWKEGGGDFRKEVKQTK